MSVTGILIMFPARLRYHEHWDRGAVTRDTGICVQWQRTVGVVAILTVSLFVSRSTTSDLQFISQFSRDVGKRLTCSCASSVINLSYFYTIAASSIS